MFDLVNANAQYQTQTKMFIKSQFSNFIDDSLILYLENIKDLDTYKIARFTNLDNNVSLYCQWLYQFYYLQDHYDEFFEHFTKSQMKEISESSDDAIRDYNKTYFKIIWPKILLSYKYNLDFAKQIIIKKFDYFASALDSIEKFHSEYSIHKSLSKFKNFEKNSFFQKGKYSLSYLKIGFPIYLGYRQEIIEKKSINPDNFDWQGLNEFLQTMCLIHSIQNNSELINQITMVGKTIDQKVKNQSTDTQVKKQVLDSFYIKAKTDLAKLKLIDKHKTSLENILNWCYDYADENSDTY
jgi:hypothetical protein